MYFVQHGKLFQTQNISFSTSLLESLQTDQDFNVVNTSDYELSQSDNCSQSNDNANISNLRSTSAVTPATAGDDDDDMWTEVTDNNSERAGVFDTLFTSPDFVEADERQTVYQYIDSGQSDKVYSFAPAEHNRPISIFLDRNSEELAFPNIFWGHARSEIHTAKLHYSDITKSELRRRDRRVASSVDNIFFKVKRCQMQQIMGKVSIAVRKHKTGNSNFKARDLRGLDAIDKLIKFDDGYRVLKEIRGSPPYWEKAQKDLYAMIRQLGPANLFLTLGAAETRWTDLLRMLCQTVDNFTPSDDEVSDMSWSTKCRLISSDPVTCARHFDHCVHYFFKTFLKSDFNPFGQLADFWYRIEFQYRGSPHVHCLLWISNVPVYGVDSTDDVITYIDKILTCQRTWNYDDIDGLVEYQLHRHTRTCKKQFRKRTVCRFDFPKLPMTSTRILQPLPKDDDDDSSRHHADNFTRIKSFLANFKTDAEFITMDEFLSRLHLDLDSYILAVRSSLRTSTVFIRRSPSEVRVNNYNVHCLQAWRANMDIQFILDVYACATYITSYVSKGERGMSDLLRSACREAKQGNSNLKQQVRIIGNKFLNNVEMSAQEAVYHLLQLSFKRSSRQTVFVNTSPLEERVYLLKSNLDLLPDDAEVTEGNMISRYAVRSSALENVCLADFAALYDRASTSSSSANSDDELQNEETSYTNDHRGIKKKRILRVLRFVHFNPLADAEKSARAKLMLYSPWRNELSDLYGQFQTYAEHYTAVKDDLTQLVKKYEPFEDEISAAQDKISQLNVQDEWDLLAPGLLHSDASAQAAGTHESELHAALDPAAHGQNRDADLAIDLGLGRVEAGESQNSTRYDMSETDYFNLMKSLNCQQMEFVYDTLHHLKTSLQPVYRFVSGGAGTGKSYVLKALRESADRYFKTRSGANFEQHWTMTLAPTGKAVFLVGGGTIHSVLHVPANQSLTYRRLDHESLNTLRSQIGHIKLWLIDEISMVGHRLFLFIDQRLQEVANTNQPFGGTSVVAFGDFYQLPPVMDRFVFDDFSLTNSKREEYHVLAPNRWSELFKMFELTQIMRQQDCIQFAELLNRMREGLYTVDDIQTLETRLISADAPDYPASAQHLFRTNAEVDRHNSQVFNTCTLHKLTVAAVDSVVGVVSDDLADHILQLVPQDARKTMQLPEWISLAVGCRYEISINVNISDGLANSAGGVLQKIQLSGDSHSASGVIWLQFDDASVGSQARADNRALYKHDINHSWTPIQPICRKFQVGKSHTS